MSCRVSVYKFHGYWNKVNKMNKRNKMNKINKINKINKMYKMSKINKMNKTQFYMVLLSAVFVYKSGVVS